MLRSGIDMTFGRLDGIVERTYARSPENILTWSDNANASTKRRVGEMWKEK
jgi:hypothetical protein